MGYLLLNDWREGCWRVGFIILTHQHSRVPIESIICYFYTFEKNLRIKGMFVKYLNEGCFVASGEHSSFKYFIENAFISKIFPK